MFAIPVIAVCFCIFVLWTHYEMKKSGKKTREIEEAFWAREYEANHAPKKDFSDLPLLSFDESVIPLAPDGTFTESDDVTAYIKSLRSLLREPMIDLSEYSNTDLKLAYGVGNFKTLTDYDENYNNFLLMMTNLARGYERREMHELAIATYRSALDCGSIKLHDYTGLAEIYLTIDEPAKINELIEEVEKGDNPRKDGVTDALRRVLAKY